MKKAALYLKKDGFQIFYEDFSKVADFKFPLNQIKNLDVVNVANLSSSIKPFLSKNNITKMDIIIILSEDISFFKQTDDSTKADGFLNKIPFEKELIISKQFLLNDHPYTFAVNKNLYTYLLAILLELNNKVNYIIPEYGLSISSIRGLSSDDVQQVVHNKSLLKILNIYQKEQQNVSVKRNLSKIFLIFIILFTLVGATYYIATILGIHIFPVSSNHSMNSINTLESTESTSSIESTSTN